MNSSTVPKLFDIAVLPGDGIGKDVMLEAIRVLRRYEASLAGASFQLGEHEAGATAYLQTGSALPHETFNACRESDAILLGAMGLPDVRLPDGKELTPQIDLRERLDLYSGLRPTYLYHQSDSPLRGYQPEEIDFILVRENTEGLFSARDSKVSQDALEVRDIMRITRKGSKKVLRSAFELAVKRRKRVTLVDKANVLPSMAFLRSVFDEIALEYPHIETERVYVDAAALFLLRRPNTFDVMVTENMFGDILSDLASGLIGGMGMAPSADIGDECAVSQPAHGTAPDIAGKGIANPVGMILSVAMMLDWLPDVDGEPIRNAVASALRCPETRTPDMGGRLTTAQMTDAILENMIAP